MTNAVKNKPKGLVIKALNYRTTIPIFTTELQVARLTTLIKIARELLSPDFSLAEPKISAGVPSMAFFEPAICYRHPPVHLGGKLQIVSYHNKCHG